MVMTLFPHDPLFPQGKRSACEVSPLDGTALVTAVSNSQQRAIGNLTPGAEDDWTDQIKGLSGDETSFGGDIVRIRGGLHLRRREFPRSPEGARTPMGPLAFEGRASRKRK